MILQLKWLSRPTSMLFKEAHHDHSSQNLKGSYIFTFTSTFTQTVREGQRQFLDVPFVILTRCNELCFAQFHAKIHNIKKKKKNKKRFIVMGMHCLFHKSLTLRIFGVIIVNVYLTYHLERQSYIYQVSKTIFFIIIQLREEAIF